MPLPGHHVVSFAFFLLFISLCRLPSCGTCKVVLSKTNLPTLSRLAASTSSPPNSSSRTTSTTKTRPAAGRTPSRTRDSSPQPGSRATSSSRHSRASTSSRCRAGPPGGAPKGKPTGKPTGPYSGPGRIRRSVLSTTGPRGRRLRISILMLWIQSRGRGSTRRLSSRCMRMIRGFGSDGRVMHLKGKV